MKTEHVSLGDIYLGKLLTWPGKPVARFFYEQTPSTVLNGVAMTQPMSKDFDSRASFFAWLSEQTITKKVEVDRG